MKEELPGDTRRRKGSKLANEINNSRSQNKNSINGTKLRDAVLRRPEPVNGVRKEINTKVKTNFMEGNTLTTKGIPTSVIAPSKTPVLRRSEPAKKKSAIPILEVHQNPEFASNKTPVSRQSPKVRTSEGYARMKRSQRPPNSWESDCNITRRVAASDDESGQLKKLVKELQKKEEKLQNELQLEQKELNRTVHKVAALEKQLSTKCGEIEYLNRIMEYLKTEHSANVEQQLQEMKDLKAELIQLRNLNMELEQQKREMANKLEAAESQFLPLSHATEAKIHERPNGTGASFPLLSKTISTELAGKYPVSKTKHDLIYHSIEHDKVEMAGQTMVEKEAITVKQPLLTKFISSEDGNKSLRLHKPPPKPPSGTAAGVTSAPLKGTSNVPPPPPPPPPHHTLHPKFIVKKDVVQKAPEVVRFYHSLMKRDGKKDSCGTGLFDNQDVAIAHSDMIGEIKNRSAHLLAIKSDVETKGDFVRSLIREVQAAAYTDMDDVLAFVQWLDDELAFLVDERAVLKHFDWPEKKADTMREAAFGYQDSKRLESEVWSYEDDLRQPCDVALKKMTLLLEKLEQSVYNLLRKRETANTVYKEFDIPTDWMLDNGMISKIKVASVKLAKKYMNRISIELESMGSPENEPAQEFLLLQGVRFAFRAHQFAGGFDEETMHAFEELRQLACIHDEEQQNLQFSGLSVQ